MSTFSPTLSPVERVARALHLEKVAPHGATLNDVNTLWDGHILPVERDIWMTTATRVLQIAAVDPGLLRWCDWPECLASFLAHPGPAERGWTRHPYALLCPTHAPLGHGPSVKWDGDALTAICSCGASDEISPTNGQAVKTWWRGHVTEVTR